MQTAHAYDGIARAFLRKPCTCRVHFTRGVGSTSLDHSRAGPRRGQSLSPIPCRTCSCDQVLFVSYMACKSALLSLSVSALSSPLLSFHLAAVAGRATVLLGPPLEAFTRVLRALPDYLLQPFCLSIFSCFTACYGLACQRYILPTETPNFHSMFSFKYQSCARQVWQLSLRRGQLLFRWWTRLW